MTPSMTHTNPGGAVLIVFPFCLDHVGHGNIQRILAIARYLVAAGHDVDLVYQGNQHQPQVTAQHAGFRQVFRVDAGSRSSDEEAWGRRVAEFYCGQELPARNMQPSVQLSTLVRALVEAHPYRAVVSTYAFTAPIFAGLGRRLLTICDVQDILHEHAAACREATGQSSSFSLPAATEAFLWRQWDVLVAITPEDEVRIGRDALPQQHVISARHAVSTFAAGPMAGADDVALYAGSDNGSNIQSVTWLLEHVWPRVSAARPSARLRIAGLICRALPEAVRHVPGVDVLGFLPDLTAEVANCGVLVAPYLYGSGLKIKVVEAACLGKAIITTSGGVIGSGLDAGVAVEVHDDAGALAQALAGLLGDRARRESLATAALAQAANLYSPHACYSLITRAMALLATPSHGESGHGIASAVVGRIQVVVDQVQPARVILWGNGAHTRSLLAALAGTPVAVALIADGRATNAGTSPEGVPVMPSGRIELAANDLVVLSSETFEQDMWRDIAAFRRAGGKVLGLFDPTLISPGIVNRLSVAVKVRLGAEGPVRRGGTETAHVLWDSQATAVRWWRLCALTDHARAAARRGEHPVIATHASLAGAEAALADVSAVAPVAPIIELDGRALEQLDREGGHRGLARLVELIASSAPHQIASLDLRADDTLTLVAPTLAECFGLARALRSRHSRSPTVVVYGLPPAAAEALWLGLPESERRAFWRLAMSALADAVSDKLAIVTTDAATADALSAFLDRPVAVVNHPGQIAIERGPARSPSIVCLGHVGAPNVRPVLESIVESVPEGIQWRSNQSDRMPGADDRWAPGLASLLGVTLLDDLTPSSMRHAITSARAVVMLSDSPREAWRDAAAFYASSAGVPVLEPDTSLNAVLRSLFNEATR